MYVFLYSDIYASHIDLELHQHVYSCSSPENSRFSHRFHIESRKKRFSCGADTAKRVHALAVTILQDRPWRICRRAWIGG